MRLPRYPIAALMAAVAFVAIAVAALRAGSFFWSSAVFTLAVASFLAATIAAVANRPPARYTAMAFASFGFVALIGFPQSPPPGLLPHLLMRQSAFLLDGGSSGLVPWGDGISHHTWEAYHSICGSLGALIFAMVGAVLSRFISPRDPGDSGSSGSTRL
jgi:hypothetical protein